MSKPGKSTVELSAAAPRPSRIRREPPPRPAQAKDKAMADVAEREAWTVALGILMFGLAIAIITIAVGNFIGR